MFVLQCYDTRVVTEDVLSFQGCGTRSTLANVEFSCGPRLFSHSGTGRAWRGCGVCVCACAFACVSVCVCL